MTKYNLYPTLSTKNINNIRDQYMDFLQYSDGKNTIEEISKKIKLNLGKVKKIYKLLKDNQIIY